MIQLFLDGVEVIPDNATNIKVIKENPYFTLSDSYTLEVSVPMDIYGNRRFFGDIVRTEKSKAYREYDARLVADNRTILRGQARTTQSTNREVKLQLTTGVSALKMTAANGNMYIDEMELGELKPTGLFNTRLDSGYCSNAKAWGEAGDITGWGIPLIDETNGLHSNVCTSKDYNYIFNTTIMLIPYVATCPKLVDTAKAIARKLGYSLETSCLPRACYSIYIITGAMSHRIGMKLPHWTVAEFFDEFQNFFGCTLEDAGDKVLRMVPLNSYVERDVTEIVPADDFETDYTEEDDAKGIINSNVEFSFNASDTEVVQEEVLESAKERMEFDSVGEAMSHFSSNAGDNMRTIYDVGGMAYIGWDTGNGYTLRRVAPFNKLDRYKGAQTVNLKISPAHIVEEEECGISWNVGDSWVKGTFVLAMPSVSNSLGVINRGYGGGDSDEQNPSLQSLIEGVEELRNAEDKADVLSVAFLTESDCEVDVTGTLGKTQHGLQGQIRLPFTDYAYKPQRLVENRERWSLSLNRIEGAEFHLGQMHRLDWQCSRKCKTKVLFEADDIPDPKNIFLIRNRRYACEKIEADLKEGKLDRMMTGYFYEMADNGR